MAKIKETIIRQDINSLKRIIKQFVMQSLTGLVITLLILCVPHLNSAQQNYIDFDGVKVVYFGLSDGMLDSVEANPATDAINPSAFCAMYIRGSLLYDNLKIYPIEKLKNVSLYINNTFQTPKIKMKLYTSAPPGTRIEIKLGPKSDDGYPSGVHSEFAAVTSVQYAWELITFHYYNSPDGGSPSPYNIDKLILFFHPNSNDRDTFYFDDLTGPELLASSNDGEEKMSFRLFQNSPNPARQLTFIKFQLNTSDDMSLKLYDLIGNEVMTILDERLLPGNYSYPVETANLTEGIYFYILKKNGEMRSMKMIVSK